MRFLFLLLIIIPIIEMWLLIVVGQSIGAIPTILLVMLTAIIGLHGLRRQGLSTLNRLQTKLSDHQLPAKEIVEGIILAVGGALLLSPGFVTDTVGFSCLIPLTRRFWLMAAFTWFQSRLMSSTSAGSVNAVHTQSPLDSPTGEIIEGECSDASEKVK